jgi:hypothetical protein
LAICCLLAGVLALSACGGGDEDASSGSSGSTETESLATAPTDTAPTETEPGEEDGGSGSGGGAEAPGSEEPGSGGGGRSGSGDGSGGGGGSGSGGAEAPSGGESGSGGAGDEEPARTLALFTGRDGRITPRVIRVPAFISVRLELRSADGGTYGLRFGDKTITTGGELGSHSTTIDGLRPGKAIAGTPTGAGNRVRVEATAEPGP